VAADAELERLYEHVARTAHDLSNVLGAVLNYTTFLAEDLASNDAAADARAYLPHLEGAARRAVELVDRLTAGPQ
jgi:signal transduction histidine kinase